ncbi:tRNA pseudouridine(13) synthase TruD [Helicobacter sp.]|uniref:tRNA pseudouridine(13) synthase TruD n=1 Tax=Helicobacter sp. TaxID=218 RepID=UPI0025C29009|nr:tRNA pseudouridine(13) synthase TruD [Helicobacter sp.]
MYFAYAHAPIECYFAHSARDFVVQELPLYDFSGSGEHRILKVRKKNLTTFELIGIIAKYFNLPAKSIGYAGLKDKHATTTQYLSIPAKNAQDFHARFNSIAKEYDIKLLDSTLHSNKLRLGHLKGNRFFMRLKKLTPANAKKLESTFIHIAQNGFPNFFGFQRFGINGDNYLLGRALNMQHSAKSTITIYEAPYLALLTELVPELFYSPSTSTKQKRAMREFFISSYQSFLFNGWLRARICLSAWVRDSSVKDLQEFARHYATKPSKLESSFCLERAQDACATTLCARFLQSLPKAALESLHKQSQAFTLLDGDLCCHYPHGKLFTLDIPTRAECERFFHQGFSPTGALSGQNLKYAHNLARQLERNFISPILAPSSRRYAWVWASDVEYIYKPQVAQAELHFSLPSGAYATSFLEQILKQHLKSQSPTQSK